VNQRCQHQPSIIIGRATIQPSLTVRDLGAIFSSELSFGLHISQLVSRCFYQLGSINSCVKLLPTGAAKSVVNSFIIARVNYYNCLLVDCPCCQLDRLQVVMNTGAQQYNMYNSTQASPPWPSTWAAGPKVYPVKVVSTSVKGSQWHCITLLVRSLMTCVHRGVDKYSESSHFPAGSENVSIYPSILPI